MIIAFYKKIKALKLIAAALELQTEKDFEVIIADDGSPRNITEQIESIRSGYSFPVRHIWHEDAGFRKNIILNKAICQSKSDYLIFIDGDCIPHHRFVEDHINQREINTALAGRRVKLSPRLSISITEDKIRNRYLQKTLFRITLLKDGIFGKSTQVEKGIYISNRSIRKLFNRKKPWIVGCNFSVWKKDLLAINGFDERYLAPYWGEDCDIEARLRWNKGHIKSIKNVALQYHLDHPSQAWPPESELLYREVLKNKIIFTPFGIQKGTENII